MTPITQSPEWKALARHHEQIERAHLRDLFADDPTRGETMTLEVGDLYLDYSKNRFTGRDVALLVALAERAGLRDAHRRHVRRREDQRHRGPGRPARRAARAARASTSSSTARTSCPRCTRCSTRWPPSPTEVRSGEWTGTPAGGSATSSTSASAAPTSAPRWPTRRCRTSATATSRCASSPTSTAPTSSRRRRTSTPHETLFIVCSKTFTTLETLTNARTARDWLLDVAEGRRAPSPSTSSPSRPTPRRSRSSASTRRTCSSSGTGSAVATRTTRRSACRS